MCVYFFISIRHNQIDKKTNLIEKVKSLFINLKDLPFIVLYKTCGFYTIIHMYFITMQDTEISKDCFRCTVLLPNINQTYSDKIDINLSLLWICFQLRPINRFLLPRFSLRSCEWPLGSIKKRDILVENMFFSFYIIRLISGRINNVVTSCPKANYFKSLHFSFHVQRNV